MNMKCSNGHQNSGDKKFCTLCGVSMLTCSRGHIIDKQSLFCSECGEQLSFKKSIQSPSDNAEIEKPTPPTARKKPVLKRKRVVSGIVFFVIAGAIFSIGFFQNTTEKAKTRPTVTASSNAPIHPFYGALTFKAQPDIVAWLRSKNSLIQEMKNIFDSAFDCNSPSNSASLGLMLSDLKKLESGAPLLVVKGNSYRAIQGIVQDTYDTFNFKPGCQSSPVVPNGVDVFKNYFLPSINTLITGGTLSPGYGYGW